MNIGDFVEMPELPEEPPVGSVVSYAAEEPMLMTPMTRVTEEWWTAGWHDETPVTGSIAWLPSGNFTWVQVLGMGRRLEVERVGWE